MSGIFINIPGFSGQNFKNSVATASDLPLVGNQDGDVRVVIDEHSLYIWNDGLSAWEVATGNAPGSGALVVDRFILNAGQITAKAVTLSSSPVSPSKTILEPEGGPRQRFSIDFTISGSTLSWNALTLDGVLLAGEELIVIHD